MTEDMMAANLQPSPERRSALQRQILDTIRRVRDGLDPDEVSSQMARMQARIEQLESRVRHSSASAILDTALQQAAEIRRQALEAAERTYFEILSVAEQEAARQREDAAHEARRLLEEVHAEMRAIQERIDSLIPMPAPDERLALHDRPPQHVRPASERTERSHPPGSGANVTRIAQQRTVDTPGLDGDDDEPPFRLPAWIEQ